jgi:uncharacterized protein YcfL
MKKLFAILAVAAFVFAACGQKAETETTDSTAVVVEEVAPVADVDTTIVDSTVAEVPAN